MRCGGATRPRRLRLISTATSPDSASTLGRPAFFRQPSPRNSPTSFWGVELYQAEARPLSTGPPRTPLLLPTPCGAAPLRKGVGCARAAATQPFISSATSTPPYLGLLLIFPFEGQFSQGVTPYFDFAVGNSLRARKLPPGGCPNHLFIWSCGACGGPTAGAAPLRPRMLASGGSLDSTTVLFLPDAAAGGWRGAFAIGSPSPSIFVPCSPPAFGLLSPSDLGFRILCPRPLAFLEAGTTLAPLGALLTLSSMS